MSKTPKSKPQPPLSAVRPSPCRYCPYRTDVPSGVWGAEEYEKLKAYDRPMIEQPPAVFACHETPQKICSGWAQCHGYDSFAMRLHSFRVPGCVEIPEPTTPIFSTGTEAAEHGLRDMLKPKAAARRAIAYLMKLTRIKSHKPNQK